jgi:hypothetical protein
MFVLVTNTGAPFTGRFDGRNYDFNTGEEVPITVDAARHIFGFGLSNKDEVFSRHTWMTKSTEREQAVERLSQFKFNIGNVQIVADTPQLEVQEITSSEPAPEAKAVDDSGHGTAPVLMGAGGGEKASDGAGKEPSAPTQTQPGEPAEELVEIFLPCG